MTSPDQDLERRRPVWDALSSFFLDMELDDEHRRHIAQTILDSGYLLSEIEAILWEELFPVARSNLCDVAGMWAGFDLDWIQEQILARRHPPTLPMRIAEALPDSPARLIRKEWRALLPFLPDDFRYEHNAD